MSSRSCRIQRGQVHGTRRWCKKELVGETGRTEGDGMAARDSLGQSRRSRMTRTCGCCLTMELDVRAAAFALNAFRWGRRRGQVSHTYDGQRHIRLTARVCSITGKTRRHTLVAGLLGGRSPRRGCGAFPSRRGSGRGWFLSCVAFVDMPRQQVTAHRPISWSSRMQGDRATLEGHGHLPSSKLIAAMLALVRPISGV